MFTRTLLILAGAGILGGCAAAPGSGVDDVQRLVADRTGQSVEWRRGPDADRAVADLVSRTLSRELTPDDAVALALLNNHGLRATLEELGIARADLMQAGLIRNPVLDLSARFPDRAPRGPNVEISISQDVLDLLMIPARKRLAAAQFEAAKSRVADTVFNLAADARAAFYTAQAARQMAELRATVAEAAGAAAEAAQRLHDAGNLNDLALSNEQASEAQAKLELAAAEAEVLDARERLTALMGLTGEDWRLAARLPELPGEDVHLHDLESRAVARRLDLAAARQAVDVAARSLGLSSQFRFLPELSVGADTERETDGSHVTGPTLSIPIPLFDQGQAAIAGGQSRLRQAREQYLALVVQAKSQVRSARSRLAAARNRADYYRRVLLPLRQRVTDATLLHYNGMSANVFDLLQAKQMQVEAGRGYVEALRDYWVARSELERAVGGRLPTPPAASQPATRPATQPSTQPATQPSHHHHHHGA